jgi:tetratricopeptide (TPR) repeat protein
LGLLIHFAELLPLLLHEFVHLRLNFRVLLVSLHNLFKFIYRDSFPFYGLLKDYEGAVAMYKKVLKLDPKNAEAYNNWGTIMSEQGEYVIAIAMYRKALKFNPNYVDAYINWGTQLTSLGENEKAIIRYKKALKIDPNNIKAQRNLEQLLKEDQSTMVSVQSR